MSQTNKRPQQKPVNTRTVNHRLSGSRSQAQSTNVRQKNGRNYTDNRAGENAYFIREMIVLLVGGLAVIVLALMLQKYWPEGFPIASNQRINGTVKEISTVYSSGPIRINEIMTADRYSVMDEEDKPVDWIEIINIGNSDVDLQGFQLAKTANASSVFTFPEMILKSGECVLVYADSKLRNIAGAELHAPFRLAAGGDTLMLFNESDTAIDTVNIPALGKDISYARMGTTEWQVCEEVTPGLANTHDNYRSLSEPAASSPIVINEVVARNKTVLTDENGQYSDFIELYNRSNETIDLSGWYLTDDKVNIRRWRFPNMSIGAGEYLIVFCSGLNRTTDSEHLHTNFGLSSEGEQIILSDRNGRRMDEVTYDLLKQDTAYARSSDGVWSMTTPTPGAANQ